MLKSSFGAILKTRLPTTSASRAGQPLAMTLRWYTEKAFQPNITFEELQERIQADKPDSFTLIDVREPGELREGIIPTATNVPLSQFADAFAANHEDFEDKLGFEKPATSDEVIVYCKAGARSAAAMEYLKSLGYARVRNYPGSYMEWASKTMK
ncbi:hypothetical protein INT44_004614 [Umbelopsis vinacea]|uniref:Rhodanese domain-containing protein n=1 Tax=Umbelopsis vinacea TaxID=44442 RepID=A0A8H7UPN1_9FUNG|nr:hypothetical protein INT44_004614 [Umbelopsis vinacea]